MQKPETIAEYSQRYDRALPDAGQVAVYRIEDVAAPQAFPHIRRDFYKIKLLCGAQGSLSYADERVEIRASALIFANPLIPYAWERTAGRETGFACLFTEEFIRPLRTGSLAESPLFWAGGTPVLFPPPEVVGRLQVIFEQLLIERQSAYAHRHDLLRTYVQLLLHESLRLLPDAPAHPLATAATRLSASFLDLLGRQFPLASPHHALPLKNANEFARQLAVHPNHLNKALKATTGQTTTAHIAAKVVAEAQALLRHSNWSIAQIGYCLGFEHAPNFQLFFKKHTGQSPARYRRQPQGISYVSD